MSYKKIIGFWSNVIVYYFMKYSEFEHNLYQLTYTRISTEINLTRKAETCVEVFPVSCFICLFKLWSPGYGRMGQQLIDFVFIHINWTFFLNCSSQNSSDLIFYVMWKLFHKELINFFKIIIQESRVRPKWGLRF